MKSTIELERQGYVTAGAFTPELALTNPNVLRTLYREFAHAGTEVLQVMAFYGSHGKLSTVGQTDHTIAINRAAAQPVDFRCSAEVPWFTGTSAFPGKLDPTQLTRYEMADFTLKAKDMGGNCIGSCCGSIAAHVREMARTLGKYCAQPTWSANPTKPMSETEFNWERHQGR